MQEAALASDLSSVISAYVQSRIDAKVKPDKKQRGAMQSLAGADVLQLLLRQVVERASLDGVVIESFYLQQQIHWEIEKHPTPSRLAPPQMMRNLHRLLSRMSWDRMIQFVRQCPACQSSFLDDVQARLVSLRPGHLSDPSGLRHAKSVWL
ncbi:unnamed protein product [Symbiodinium microadriaticum]|nr:unnamed protein product [Symbiodinium microadriaticum]CAE7948141.1 unnamed protein product [Symbiodinium sp. KB8]